MFSEDSDIPLAISIGIRPARKTSLRSLLKHVLGYFCAIARGSVLVGQHVIDRRVLFGQMLENLAEATVVALFSEGLI